jgi:hypothetical protein
MKMPPAKLMSLILGLVIITSCCLFLYFSFISYPSTYAIADQYLKAVIDENYEAAIKLGRSYCQEAVQETALRDIEQFGRAEIRNVVAEVRASTGSDDEIQFAEIKFEYRKRAQTEWQSGKLRVLTDHEVPGFRYFCGSTP